MHDLARSATLRRWQLGVLLLLIFLAVGTSIGLGVVILNVQAKQTALVVALQQNRVQSIADLCERDNRDNGRNILFVKALGNKPDVVHLAERIYKLNPDCRAYARSLVHPKP